MAEPIDSVLAGKLGAYTVPALPPGFADRLVAAALADPVSTGSALPRLRRPSARRWLRGGVAGLGVIAVGMISISAAAMGYFGEPIRLAVVQTPVVGKVIERVLPKSLRREKHEAPAKLSQAVARPVALPVQSPVATTLVPDDVPPAQLTPIERRQRFHAILADPAARQAWIEAHPKAAQRIARRRAEVQRRRADAGLAPQARLPLQGPVRPLLRREGLPMMERRERIEQLRERRQLMLERRGMLRSDRPFRRPFRGGP